MRSKLRYWVGMVLVLSCFIVALSSGCNPRPKDELEANGYEVIDDFGYTTSLPKKPVRIFATTMSLNEILVDLVPPERIVAIPETAIDSTISLIPEKAEKVSLKVPEGLSAEGIVALQPDLVIVQVSDNAMVETLRDLGIPVLATKVPTNLEMIREHIYNMSLAVGEPQRGEDIINELNNEINTIHEITNQIPDEQVKTLIAYSANGAFGSAEGLFHDICNQARVKNGAALAGLIRGEHLGKEKIISVNPDIFLLPRSGSTKKGDENTIFNNIINDPALETVKAVKTKEIIQIKDRYRYAASQYMGDAVYIISSCAYPEWFEGKDIPTIDPKLK